MNSEDKSIIQKYNPSEIEAKWQKKWEESGIYKPDLDKATKPFYNLMMFPYPSAEGMHVGNMYAFTGADVYGRFQRMQGKDVFEPIGLDGFGIHSENYAIKIGKNPMDQAKISEKNFYRQLRSIGNGFDWTRTVETYKPDFYKWTQWIFIQLFKAGLAYRKKAPVNFCPSCKTVLSDEQVIDGLCERCNSMVEKRDLEQWFFKITKYADRLLSNLTQIDWSEKVKIAQKLWIGKSEGARVRFKINDFPIRGQVRFKNKDIEVFTTRPDTLFGATFLVLSPEYPLVSALLSFKRPPPLKLKSYVEEARKKTEQERIAEGKEKTGVFTGVYAINPVNNEKIPVWVADYVLMGYGTGAIMAVPAHDSRDYEFAKKFKLQIKQVIDSKEADIAKKAFVGEGKIINSGEWNGWETPDSIEQVIDWLEKKGLGKKEANYHLRDWLISRQRYWGPPIPMINCSKCGWQSVPEDQLPVELPFIEDYKPLGTGKAPLASHPEFYETKCPKCGGEAKRETDVSDTFLDSSWYFLRYLATDREDIPFPMKNSKFEARNSKQIQNSNVRDSKQFRISNFDIRAFAQRVRWLPVNMYIGGAEHSVLHLLYSRFMTMALHDLGFISFEEPFTQFRAHGLIVKDGAKMSKSKGNVVVPDAYIKKFGADALRTYLMFMGPFSQGGDFRDSGIEGMFKFLNRVWNLTVSKEILKEGEIDIYLQKLTEEITEEIKNLRYNTAISRLMMYYNFLIKKNAEGREIFKSEIINFIKMIAPFAPHLAEEIWELLGQKFSVHFQTWPKIDKDDLKGLYGFTIAIQINGKTRATIDSEINLSKEEAEKRSRVVVEKYLKDKKVVRVIYVERKVVNFVVSV